MISIDYINKILTTFILLILGLTFSSCIKYTPKGQDNSGVFAGSKKSGSSDNEVDTSISAVTVEDESDGTGSEVTSTNIIKNQSLRIYAIGRDSGGQFVSLVTVAWSISSDSIGEISSSSGNTTAITGKNVGNTAVSVEHSSFSVGSISISVSEYGAAAKLSISSAETATVGASLTITVNITDIYGNNVPYDNNTNFTATAYSQSTSQSIHTERPLIITNGEDTFSLTHDTAESVTIKLSDNGNTGINITDEEQITFN